MKAPRLLIGLLAAATLIQTAGASGAFVTGSGDSSPASGIFQSSGAGAAASPLAPGRSAVKARLITAQTAAVPGKSLKLAVELTHDAGWHTYWKNPGDVGSPTEFQWTVPSGWKVTGPAWPEPTETQALSLTNYGISGKALYPFTASVPQNASGTALVRVHVSWVACKEQCVPGDATLETKIPVASSAAASPEAPLIEAAESQVPDPAPKDIRAVKNGSRVLISVPGHHVDITFFPDAPGTVFKPDAGPAIHQGDATARAYTVSVQPGSKFGLVDGLLLVDGGKKNGGATYQLTVTPESGSVPAAAAAAVTSGGTGTPDGGLKQLTFLTAALFAALGGLILNLMPCVFPVLSLKMLDLIGASNDGRLIRHGLAFTAGVLLTMGALSGTLIALQAAGASLGWGFQLQNPVIVLILALLFLAITMNLAGVFEFTLGSRAGGNLALKTPTRGLLGSFFTGILAVIVASPCTAPFMGAALGFALSQPAAIAVTVFLVLGFGMALPWLLLTIFPGWVKWLPKPGAWMETLKKVMAIPVGLAAVWLLWVLSQQLSRNGLMIAAGILVLAAVSLWLIGRGQRLKPFGGLYPASFPAAAAAALVLYIGVGQFAPAAMSLEGTAWQAWSPEAVQAARNSGKPVFIDFTAAWCVTCQVNKKAVIDTEDVESAARSLGYARFLADWTNKDPAISAELARYRHNGVPLYIVISKSGAVKVLPELLTKDTLLSALKEGAN